MNGLVFPHLHRNQVKGLVLVVIGLSVTKPLTKSALGGKKISIIRHAVGAINRGNSEGDRDPKSLPVLWLQGFY